MDVPSMCWPTADRNAIERMCGDDLSNNAKVNDNNSHYSLCMV